MNKQWMAVALCGFTTCAWAQGGGGGMELIRNGGFEEVTGKVKTFDQIDEAQGWSNVTLGISEVFVPGASPKTVGVPLNDYGQMEAKEGSNYAGFFAWKDDKRFNWGGDPDEPFKEGWNSYSEYIQRELEAPLIKGRTYELSFFIALSGNSDRAVSGISAYLGPRIMNQPHRRFLREAPQVYTETIQDQKGEWVEIKGKFKADGDENAIVIGVFPFVGFNTKKLIESYDNQYAYYYIDGISLKEVRKEEK